jgi:hypothetical protein
MSHCFHKNMTDIQASYPYCQCLNDSYCLTDAKLCNDCGKTLYNTTEPGAPEGERWTTEQGWLKAEWDAYRDKFGNIVPCHPAHVDG